MTDTEQEIVMPSAKSVYNVSKDVEIAQAWKRAIVNKIKSLGEIQPKDVHWVKLKDDKNLVKMTAGSKAMVEEFVKSQNKSTDNEYWDCFTSPAGDDITFRLMLR
jgi:hypothetical protein